jgi:hypothetical protein
VPNSINAKPIKNAVIIAINDILRFSLSVLSLVNPKNIGIFAIGFIIAKNAVNVVSAKFNKSILNI